MRSSSLSLITFNSNLFISANNEYINDCFWIFTKQAHVQIKFTTTSNIAPINFSKKSNIGLMEGTDGVFFFRIESGF